MNRRPSQSAFTLLELILVMLILAITSAMVVPSLASFAISRSTDNAVLQIMNLAQYARAQCVTQGKTYRLNFDTQSGQTWLTFDNGSTYQPVPNDFGNRYSLANGMKMQVQVTVQPNTQLIMTPNVTPIPDIQPMPAFGQPVWPLMNTVSQITHTDGTYIEYQPSGRTDPVLIRLSDSHGREVDLGLATSTEALHILKPEEMR